MQKASQENKSSPKPLYTMNIIIVARNRLHIENIELGNEMIKLDKTY